MSRKTTQSPLVPIKRLRSAYSLLDHIQGHRLSTPVATAALHNTLGLLAIAIDEESGRKDKGSRLEACHAG